MMRGGSRLKKNLGTHFRMCVFSESRLRRFDRLIEADGLGARTRSPSRLARSCSRNGSWILKLLVFLLIATIAHSGAAFAAVEQCRFIEKKQEREACYTRQAEALAEKHKASAAVKVTADPVQQMKLEDENFSRRLRSICRGC
jgi:hypothetical protein